MKLFYTPGACSIGIHLLLEEIGKPFELIAVKLAEGAHLQPAFKAVNPKSKVPALVRDDGSVITEFQAIALWLALTNPAANLLPADPEALTRGLEIMEYSIATQHMHAFSRMFNPRKYAQHEADYDTVRAQGRAMAEAGFEVLNAALAGKDYAAGASLSIFDAAVFYVEFWGASRMGMTLPANCAAHFARMKARPAVARALATEGLA